MLRSRFFWKLYAGIGLLIFLTTVIGAVLSSERVHDDALDRIRNSLLVRAELLRQQVRNNLTDTPASGLQSRIKTLGASIGTRLTIIAADGTVIADSSEDPERMDNHTDRPEIIQARAGTAGTATRFSDTLAEERMYLALPIREKGKLTGFVRTSLSTSSVDRSLTGLSALVLTSGAAALFIALLSAFWLTRRITGPIQTITSAARELSAGNFDHPISVRTRDEFADLAETFNTMAKELRERIENATDESHKLSAILGSMVEGVVAIDREERIVHINAVAGAILHAVPGPSLGKSIREVGRAREVADALADAMEETAEVKREVRLTARPADRTLALQAAPLRHTDGTLSGAVVVIHDVTELRRLEQIRRDFVANVSHELKTPLTAIRGLIETVSEDPEMAPEVRTRFIGKVRSQAERLSALVSDLLTLSRAESEENALDQEPLDFGQPVADSVDAHRLQAEEKSLTLDLDRRERPVTVRGDAEALREVADNLLVNAIRYTPEGGGIRVTVSKEGSKGVLEVTDTGVGIEPAHLDRIFERFYRVDKARSRELGGTGLGLSIVRNTLQVHKGTVSVKSEPGTGSTFRVEIPLIRKS